MICTWLHHVHLSAGVGDVSRCSEEIVTKSQTVPFNIILLHLLEFDIQLLFQCGSA